MNSELKQENSGQLTNKASIARPPRKPRMKKAEDTVYYDLLVEDIRLNGPRQPVELARQYGLSEKKVSELLTEARLKDDIAPSTLDYSVTSTWGIKSFIQKTMRLDNKALLKIEGDENALLITPLK